MRITPEEEWEEMSEGDTPLPRLPRAAKPGGGVGGGASTTGEADAGEAGTAEAGHRSPPYNGNGDDDEPIPYRLTGKAWKALREET